MIETMDGGTVIDIIQTAILFFVLRTDLNQNVTLKNHQASIDVLVGRRSV